MKTLLVICLLLGAVCTVYFFSETRYAQAKNGFLPWPLLNVQIATIDETVYTDC